MKVFVRFAVAVALLWPSPALAQLTVLHSGGFAAPYQEVLPTFENTTGLKVASTQASSQGQTSNTIPSRLRAGMAADVVIMTREGLTELVAEGRIDANSIVISRRHHWVPLFVTGCRSRTSARSPHSEKPC